MGSILSTVWTKFFAVNRDIKILMVGLDAAGKTTILYQLRLGEMVTSIPTIGFNVETVSYKNVNFNVGDIGGQKKLRSLWQHYYENNDAIVYVVDAADTERIEGTDGGDSAKEELNHLLAADQHVGVPLLVYANKQDMPGALNAQELTTKLGLHTVKDRQWFV